MEEKKSKFNYGEPLKLDDIPIEECEEALYEFSDGSNGLNKCLRTMWMHGLKTHSCKKGNNSFDEGHITMEEDEDIFSYLSKEFLNDERVRIDIKDNREVVLFLGSSAEKEGVLLFLAREIQSGRKNNRTLIKEKIGEPFPDSWIRRLKNHDSNIDSKKKKKKIYIKRK